VALSVGVQHMVRSDLAASGVIFTLDPESGFRDVVVVDSIWGIGENIVQGRATPDEFVVHKPTLRAGFRPIVRARLGAKELLMAYDEAESKLVNRPTPETTAQQWSVTHDDVLRLAQWAIDIEDHYTAQRGTPTPMDIEWAKDGVTGELFIVQARPETVHSQRGGAMLRTYRLAGDGEVLVRGIAVGHQVASGTVRVIDDARQMDALNDGDILVTMTTDPDWEPVMKRASAIVTERGGRTSHAAIVARELGVPAVVGAQDALRRLFDGETATVSCIGEEGVIYRGMVPFEVTEMESAALPATRTKVLVNLGDPAAAFSVAALPVDGVGLVRLEFILASHVGVHPMALLYRDQLDISVRRDIDAITRNHASPAEFFVDRLAQGVGSIAAAMYPRPVILRFSDFKSNEYRSLLGGDRFEPAEENPMIGWRGASRYYDPDYIEAFQLELHAVRRVREVFGLTNLHVMIPFCRTTGEAERVLEILAKSGLERGAGGLQVYVMAEIPANVLLATEFAELFDGFSIGSNDLTQLVLGVDRDSERVAGLFDERNPAVKKACRMLIDAAHAAGRPVGICGQAPSDYPDFAAFLVQAGIDSVSLVPDALIATKRRIAEIEESASLTGADPAATEFDRDGGR
ncbi:MAG: phosphoenolpyruvate synthase, partial [Acidimicrobiia bacterium]|nr:phosphoenolpyruvate synthase [Acidimicrobiia bacterium]